jgi:hypothetical protein
MLVCLHLMTFTRFQYENVGNLRCEKERVCCIIVGVFKEILGTAKYLPPLPKTFRTPFFWPGAYLMR